MGSEKNKIPFNFMLSLAYLEHWETVLKKISSDCFRLLEVPGTFLENDYILRNFHLSGLRVGHVIDPFAISLSRSIADQTPQIIENFKKQFILILNKVQLFSSENPPKARLSAKRSALRDFPPCETSPKASATGEDFAKGERKARMSVDFGIDSVYNDFHRRSLRIQLIKELIPLLYSSNIRLCLPVRIPFSIPHAADYYISVLKALMYSGIRLSINIHPHEIGRDSSPEELLRWFRFDMDIVRFVYEPETGNVLTEKLMETWFRSLDEFFFQGPVVFCPRISSFDNYNSEIIKLADLLKRMNLM